MKVLWASKTFIDALKKHIAQLRNKVELLEKKLTEVEISCNNLEQYTRRNNTEIQGIPSHIPDEKLEEKIIEVFGAMNTAITKNDVEDCHRLGKSSKSTIVWFVNRKHCYSILGNLKLQKLTNQSLILSQKWNCMRVKT